MKEKEMEKDIKKKSKTTKKKEVSKKAKKEKFLNGVKLELNKVVWPDKKDVLKYTMATLVFCIVVMVFFQALNFGLSVIKGVIG